MFITVLDDCVCHELLEFPIQQLALTIQNPFTHPNWVASHSDSGSPSPPSLLQLISGFATTIQFQPGTNVLNPGGLAYHATLAGQP